MLPGRRDRLLCSTAATLILLLLSMLLSMAVQRSPAFTQNVYLPFSRTVSGFLGFIFSFSPYAVAEALIVMIAAAWVFLLARSVIRSARERSAVPLLIWLCNSVLCAVCAFFLFMLLWGGCYRAEKLESRLTLQTGPQDEEILFQTAMKHLDDILFYSAQVPRDASGAADAGGFEALSPEAVRSVQSLMGRYPELFGRVAVSRPKRAASYPVLGMLGISGIYIPLTGEAVVNTISTDPFLPSVMCHELAHRLGFAPEEDANFIAYLACMESETPIFRYSGALMAYGYCYGALSNPEYKMALWTLLAEKSEVTLLDYSRNSAAWDRYDGPLRKKADAVNHAYLQSMGQPEGIRSYGRVVDMLIALHLLEIDG